MVAIEKARFAVWFRRLRIASSVAVLQLTTQLVGVLTGFMLVRMLDRGEYALFTVANSMLALMGTLSDLGAQTGLLYRGGQVYQDRCRLSQLVATAVRVRFLLAGFALLVVGPLGWYFLSRNDASWVVTSILMLTIFAGSVPSSFSAVLALPLRLVGKYHSTQLADVVGAVCRLIGSAIAVLIAPLATLCLFAVLVAQSVQCLALRGSARKVMDLTAGPSAEDRQVLMTGVRALWFPTAFDAFQSQIGIWLLSILGTPADVADLGALSRFGALVSVVTAVITVPVSAVFARCQDRAQLVHLLLEAATALGCFCGVLTLLAFVFPGPFLWVLGSRYEHLSGEIGLYFIFASINTFTILLWQFARSKMWVNFNWIIPPITLLVQYILLFFLDVKTVSGALEFMIGSSLVTATITGLAALRGIYSMKTSVTSC
jgi:O-antigen/teichoic acid export membrane protein